VSVLGHTMFLWWLIVVTPQGVAGPFQAPSLIECVMAAGRIAREREEVIAMCYIADVREV